MTLLSSPEISHTLNFVIIYTIKLYYTTTYIDLHGFPLSSIASIDQNKAASGSTTSGTLNLGQLQQSFNS